MTRIIIILILVFIILTLIRNILKRVTVKPPQKDIPNPNPPSKINSKQDSGNKDDNIIDAKFEEIK